MTTNPNEPTDADPTQLHRADEAIDEAKAAAGRVARDDTIDTEMEMDLPTEEENFPAADRDPEDGDEQDTDDAAAEPDAR